MLLRNEYRTLRHLMLQTFWFFKIFFWHLLLKGNASETLTFWFTLQLRNILFFIRTSLVYNSSAFIIITVLFYNLMFITCKLMLAVSF